MKSQQTLYVTNREDWRAWLEKNYASANEIWLVYYKKHTGKPRIPYDDAVEEALCFGWIDSIIKRVDDEIYMQKFTPRKSASTWSELNKNRVQKMIRQGRMTEAGLTKIKEAKKNGTWSETVASKKAVELSPEIKKSLAANKKAWGNFNKFAPSHKRQYIGWIMSAKKEETRERRLKEAIKMLAQNKKLGMK
ncbi:YdeI/OmpD-associated family protein [bacterium]|nr:YdeI/OmpD-associated family protein [bacterium]MBU1937910.1 YdeI/OmpD-associated family protein [bacterium]